MSFSQDGPRGWDIERKAWLTAAPLWFSISLGLLGFVFGFAVGPMWLSPHSNIAPIIGIFYTGPAGFVVGLFAGAWVSYRRLGPSSCLYVFVVSATAVVFGSLYLCLPKPLWVGFIIDAELNSCMPAEAAVPAAFERMERHVAAFEGWRQPRPGWREDILRMLRTRPGVVLTVVVHRRREIEEETVPWKRGQVSARKWVRLGVREKYFARFAGSRCSDYRLGEDGYFAPEWEASDVSPPDILPTFMGLFVLEAVPEKFQRFLDDARPDS
jgi:hypothetical protein